MIVWSRAALHATAEGCGLRCAESPGRWADARFSARCDAARSGRGWVWVWVAGARLGDRDHEPRMRVASSALEWTPSFA